MSVVTYRCPKTNEEVETTIEASRDTLQRMQSSQLTIWVWCPHCIPGHQIRAKDAHVKEIDELAGSPAE
jgi:hypothetical protein